MKIWLSLVIQGGIAPEDIYIDDDILSYQERICSQEEGGGRKPVTGPGPGFNETAKPNI
jgi:hypothetical protein